MIHLLLVIAAVLFVLWLLFHAAGALVNLIWLAIIVLVELNQGAPAGAPVVYGLGESTVARSSGSSTLLFEAMELSADSQPPHRPGRR